MIRVESATGGTVSVRIESHDTIHDIAASSHFTEGEICKVIEDMILEDMKAGEKVEK